MKKLTHDKSFWHLIDLLYKLNLRSTSELKHHPLMYGALLQVEDMETILRFVIFDDTNLKY